MTVLRRPTTWYKAIRARAAIVVGTLVLLLTIFPMGGSISSNIVASETSGTNCGIHTLHSSYAYSADGYVAIPGQPFTPVGEVGTYTFDGAGNFLTTNTLSFGGQIIPRTASGTYTVNADCSGSANIINGVSFNFAITRAAKAIRLVVSSPGLVVTGTMEQQ
jgi:hypothetical protein